MKKSGARMPGPAFSSCWTSGDVLHRLHRCDVPRHRHHHRCATPHLATQAPASAPRSVAPRDAPTWAQIAARRASDANPRAAPPASDVNLRAAPPGSDANLRAALPASGDSIRRSRATVPRRLPASVAIPMHPTDACRRCASENRSGRSQRRPDGRPSGSASRCRASGYAAC